MPSPSALPRNQHSVNAPKSLSAILGESKRIWSSRFPYGDNERDGVSNHQSHDCLLNRLFKAQIKENIKAPRHWPLCGEFTIAGEFPAQMASNAENVSSWWLHHDIKIFQIHGLYSLSRMMSYRQILLNLIGKRCSFESTRSACNLRDAYKI